jgi:mRNA interferase YafQ
MLQPVYLNRFVKEFKKMKKRGKDPEKFYAVLGLLLEKKPLPAKYCNHKLKGKYIDHWECHIEPDWLLVYRKTETQIILVDTDSHSNLF